MKKTFKKLLVLVLVGTLCFGLFGCGSKKTESGNNGGAEEEQKTEKSDLASSCDVILATGYDKDDNYYELVGNEKEDYSGTVTEIGAVKNGEWSVEPTSQSKFVYNGKKLVGDETVKDNEHFQYIGNACFHYRNIIFNADKNLYYVGAVDFTEEDGETKNDGDKYVPVVGDDGILEDDEYSFGAAHDLFAEDSCFVNNEGKVLLYDNGSCAMLDTTTMQKSPVKFNTNFREKDPSFGGTKDEYHEFFIYPYSEGLIGLVDYTLDGKRDGFYDLNGNRVIDLTKYELKPPNSGAVVNPPIFKDGKCLLTIINDQDKEYNITLDKSGNVVQSEEVTTESYDDDDDSGEDY